MTALQRLANEYTTDLMRRRHWQRNSIKAPQTALRSLARSFGRRPVNRLNEAAVLRWLDENGHLAPSTRRCHLAAIAAFSRWLVRNGHLRRDPTEDIARIRRPRRIVHVVERDEIGALRAACRDARDRLIIELTYVLGLRCIEVSRLHVDDWDRRSNVLLIRGKGGHERQLPVHATVADALRDWIAIDHRTAGPMFPSTKVSNGITAQTISERISLLMYEAGIKTGPRDGKSAHALRRAAATETLDASKDIRATQHLLGHADLSSMDHYLQRPNIAQIATAVDMRFERSTGTPAPGADFT